MDIEAFESCQLMYKQPISSNHLKMTFGPTIGWSLQNCIKQMLIGSIRRLICFIDKYATFDILMLSRIYQSINHHFKPSIHVIYSYRPRPKQHLPSTRSWVVTGFARAAGIFSGSSGGGRGFRISPPAARCSSISSGGH